MKRKNIKKILLLVSLFFILILIIGLIIYYYPNISYYISARLAAPYVGPNDKKTEEKVRKYMEEIKKTENEMGGEYYDLLWKILSINTDSKWNIRLEYMGIIPPKTSERKHFDKYERKKLYDQLYAHFAEVFKKSKTDNEKAAALYVRNAIYPYYPDTTSLDPDFPIPPKQEYYIKNMRYILDNYPRTNVIPLVQIRFVQVDLKNIKAADSRKERKKDYEILKRIYANTYYEPVIQYELASIYASLESRKDHQYNRYQDLNLYIKELEKILKNYPDFDLGDGRTFHQVVKEQIKLWKEQLKMEEESR